MYRQLYSTCTTVRVFNYSKHVVCKSAAAPEYKTVQFGMSGFDAWVRDFVSSKELSEEEAAKLRVLADTKPKRAPPSLGPLPAPSPLVAPGYAPPMNTMSEKAAAWRAGAPPALATVRSPAIPTGDPRVSTEAIKAYYGQFSTDQLGFLLTNLRNFFRSENLTDVQLLFRYYISELEKRRPAASSEQTPEVLEELDNFEETETESTFSEYQPRKYIGGLPHPDPLVESSSLSAVEPPDITYTLTLPLEVASRGLLSRAQLEGVTYACQAHEQLLQTGERKGMRK